MSVGAHERLVFKARRFNRGATYREEPQLPDDSLIYLLAQTNAKVEHFDLSPDG